MTTDLDTYLAHYGVKGMKWGVRKDKAPSARKQRYDAILNAPSKSYQVTAKNGKTVTVVQDSNDKLTALFGSLSKKGVQRNADLRENHPSFKFMVDGKHVGEASFSKGGRDGDDPTEINLTWLGVKKSERGNGYGSAVFDAAVQYGRATGAKKLTLEVPGNSPDARHIYEKQGFKVTWEPTARQAKADKTWGGLIDMELDLTKARLSHSNLDEEDRFEKALAETFPSLTNEQEALVFGEVKHADEVEDFLAHYGVKGMRWGVRKSGLEGVSSRTNREAKKDATEFAKAKMFYGQGAGTRRKLIKATVESKSAKDPSYKKAFDHHINGQDMSKRASQARSERRRKDTVQSTAKTARGVKNLVLQTGAPVAVSSLIIYGAAQNPQVRAVVSSASKKTVSIIRNEIQHQRIKRAFEAGGF